MIFFYIFIFKLKKDRIMGAFNHIEFEKVGLSNSPIFDGVVDGRLLLSETDGNNSWSVGPSEKPAVLYDESDNIVCYVPSDADKYKLEIWFDKEIMTDGLSGLTTEFDDNANWVYGFYDSSDVVVYNQCGNVIYDESGNFGVVINLDERFREVFLFFNELGYDEEGIQEPGPYLGLYDDESFAGFAMSGLIKLENENSISFVSGYTFIVIKLETQNLINDMKEYYGTNRVKIWVKTSSPPR